MSDEEWRAAEEKEPGRVYLVPDYSDAERLELVSYAIFGLGVLINLVWAVLSAFA